MSGSAASTAREPGKGATAGSTAAPASVAVAGSSAHTFRAYRGGGWPRQSLYILIDFVMVLTGGSALLWLRFDYFFPRAPYGAFFLLYSALVVLFCISQNLYRTPKESSAIQESLMVAKAVISATVVLVVFIFTLGNKEVSRMVIISAGLLNVVTLSGWRYAKRRYVAGRIRQGLGTRRALIVGTTKVGKDLASCFERNLQLGYVFICPSHECCVPRARKCIRISSRCAVDFRR